HTLNAASVRNSVSPHVVPGLDVGFGEPEAKLGSHNVRELAVGLGWVAQDRHADEPGGGRRCRMKIRQRHDMVDDALHIPVYDDDRILNRGLWRGEVKGRFRVVFGGYGDAGKAGCLSRPTRQDDPLRGELLAVLEYNSCSPSA